MYCGTIIRDVVFADLAGPPQSDSGRAGPLQVLHEVTKRHELAPQQHDSDLSKSVFTCRMTAGGDVGVFNGLQKLALFDEPCGGVGHQR